jgi:hypothetical protein
VGSQEALLALADRYCVGRGVPESCEVGQLHQFGRGGLLLGSLMFACRCCFQPCDDTPGAPGASCRRLMLLAVLDPGLADGSSVLDSRCCQHCGPRG